MIVTQVNPTTGLPMVREHRNPLSAYHALPRKYFTFIYGSDRMPKGQTWVGDWQQWDATTLQRVRCQKCGTDIKGWRVALDPVGHPILVNKQPAVTFTTLPHFRQTPIQVYLPAVQEKVTFSALHCADCVIQNADAMEATTCYLQGLDAQLQRAWRQNQGQQLSRDDWASYLLTWSQAEPIGVPTTMSIDARLATLNQELLELRKDQGARLPTPGEIVTAAHYLTDVFAWKFSGLPPGIRVKYDGAPPPGWLRVTPGPVDPERYPRLAAVTPYLPNAPEEIVKL